MEKVLLTAAVKNAVKKAFEGNVDSLAFNIKVININGTKRGCSGFITNKENGITVYFDTERSVCGNTMYFRYALNEKDYTGCRNNNVRTKDELVNGICKCLMNFIDYKREIKVFKKIEIEAA